jgi:hypothetical protein
MYSPYCMSIFQMMSFLQLISVKICILISIMRVRHFLTTHYFYSIILTLFVELIITKLVTVLFQTVRFIFPMVLRPKAGHDIPIIEISMPHTTTHHSQKDFSGRVISSSQKLQRGNTQHSQPIRTHNLSSPAATELRLRPPGHWDRQFCLCSSIDVQTFA